MADIDVTDLLEDPDFTSTFNVIRRPDAVGNNGRSVIAEETIQDVEGYVMSDKPDNNERRDDSQMTMWVIDIATTFPLRGATEGGQPDIVVWEGTRFTVTNVRRHATWGRGWMWARAVSAQAADEPQQGDCCGNE